MKKTMLVQNINRKRYAAAAAAAALLVSLGGIEAANAQLHSLPTRHTREVTVQGQAALVQRLDANQTLHIVIGLPIRNQADLDGFLENLYNPVSPNYRQYLNVEQFTNMFGPTSGDYDAVIRFARENGMAITGTAPNRMIVEVDSSVANIEKAFNVTMNVYQHPTENRMFYAPDREPTVSLSAPLWHITGLDNYSIPRPNVSRSSTVQPNLSGSGPGGYFLGSDLRKAYYPSPGTLTGAGQTIGLLEFVGYDPADYQTYFTTYGPPLTTTVTPISTDGTQAICPTCEDAEQSLDIEYAISMAPGLSQCIVYVGSTDASMLNRMATDNTAKVISCSWSWRPADPTVDDPFFQQMATQGQTFASASGDSASWGSGEFNYPQEDANILCVGGTSLVTNGAGGTWRSETGWADSGGGISPDHIAIPSWQHTPKVVTARNMASRTFRNGPDVAAEGDFQNWICADGTCDGGWGGTSFACPEWAGYLAMANQQAASHSDPLLGFVNPALYLVAESVAYASNFHDIRMGSNSGFSCVPKFDLVTGWGSMNGSTLINSLAP
jgi:subtilase family serine protease